MEFWVRLAYALSHAALLICLWRTGRWREFPVLTIYAAVDGVLAFTYHPESRDWVRYWYLRIEPVALALRFVCGIEVIYGMSRNIATAAQITGASMLVGAAFSILLWSVEPGSPVYTFVQIRRYAQISTAAFLFTALSVFVIGGVWRWSIYSASAFVLLVLLVKQAVYFVLSMRGPWNNRNWHAADWPGLLVTSLCFLIWTALACRTRSAQER